MLDHTFNGSGRLFLISLIALAFVEHMFREDGKAVSSERRELAIAKQVVFKKWFGDFVLKADPESGSDAILILPFGPT